MPAAACQQKDAGQDSNHGRNATNKTKVYINMLTAARDAGLILTNFRRTIIRILHCRFM
jgi:hypothetical protein